MGVHEVATGIKTAFTQAAKPAAEVSERIGTAASSKASGLPKGEKTAAYLLAGGAGVGLATATAGLVTFVTPGWIGNGPEALVSNSIQAALAGVLSIAAAKTHGAARAAALGGAATMAWTVTRNPH